MYNKKNSKKLLLVIFGLVALLQLTAAVLPSLRSEIAYAIGDEYRFKTMAYDPADPFRGRYLRFTIDTSTVDKASEQAIFPDPYQGYNQPCYLTIKTAADGLAYFDQVLAQPPTDNRPYLKARYQYGSYDLPIGHYYVDENVAPKAEKAFFENPEDCTILLRIHKGTSVVTGMYLGDFLIDKIEF
jgi:uncharacterized membrane-anchored protein